jgi:glutathione S-transferase
MHELVFIAYSPWSMRARLALDAQGVPWKGRPYIPQISEPGLRWRLKQLTGKVTTPVLFPDDGPPLTDSFDIAAWAAARSARPLITPENRAQCEAFNQLANRALEAGRIRTTRRVRADTEALRESLPPPVRALGPVGLAIGRKASGDLISKYAVGDNSDESMLVEMRLALTKLADALQGRDWLLGDFSYADITAAASLSFVKPHESTPLGPRSRALWTEDGLAQEFSELVTWRDRAVAEAKSRRPVRT